MQALEGVGQVESGGQGRCTPPEGTRLPRALGKAIRPLFFLSSFPLLSCPPKAYECIRIYTYSYQAPLSMELFEAS